MKTDTRIRNLTPHVVVVITAGQPVSLAARTPHPEVSYQPESPAARVEQTSTPWTTIAPGVEIDIPKYGEVRDLPPAEAGTILIVSQMVALAAVARFDLVYPDSGPTAVRVDGQVRAVRRLLRPAPARSELADQRAIADSWVAAMRAMKADTLRGPVWDGKHQGIYANPCDPVKLHAIGQHGSVGSIMVDTEQCALGPGNVCWQVVEDAWRAAGGEVAPVGPWQPRAGERFRGWYGGGEVRGRIVLADTVRQRLGSAADHFAPDNLMAEMDGGAIVNLPVISHLTAA